MTADPWREGPSGMPGASAAAGRMRVSDAERAEMADALSKHYADGRLDEAEFGDRVARAMAATTRQDLSGLLVDLPADGPPPAVVGRPRHPLWAQLLTVAVLAIVVLSAMATVRHLAVLVVVMAAVWLVHRARGHGGHRGHHAGGRPLSPTHGGAP